MGIKKATQEMLRPGGVLLQVSNSGQEAWLYDDANCERIRGTETPAFDSGGMPVNFEQCAAEGLIVGYSVAQRDELSLTVYLGEAFSAQELSLARWLEPQHAFLSLPSGRLCFESNDSSRVGTSTPPAEGAFLNLPKGDYLLTLHRIDFEALQREGLSWEGSAEVLLLTPGGSIDAAVGEILPLEERRDTEWVGKYSVRGNVADVLVWFGDDWDTCIVNLDSAAVSLLSLVPGTSLQIEVPDAGVKLTSLFADSWAEAKRMPPPQGSDMDEYGYAAFCPMSDWDGAEALFCKRDTSKKRIPDQCQNIWLRGSITAAASIALKRDGNKREFVPTDLASKKYFDVGFLSTVLSEVLPNIAERDEVELAEVLALLETKLKRMDLSAQGDLSWNEAVGSRQTEMSCRLYTGQPDYFAVIVASLGTFELLLLSELKQGKWLATGLADDLAARMSSRGENGMLVANPQLNFQLIDESLGEIGREHRSALKHEAAAAAPRTLKDAAEAFGRFLAIGFSG